MDPRIRRAEVETLYAQAPPIIASNLLVSSLAAWGFWGRADLSLLIPWTAAHYLLNLTRFGMVALYRRRHAPGGDLAPWGRAYTLGALLSGSLWGSLALLFYDPAQPLLLLFAVIFICGMVAGSIASLSWHLPSFLSFSFAALLPVTLRLLFEPEPLLRSVGYAGVVFILVKLVLVRRIRAQLSLALRLGFEKEELVQSKNRFLAAASHDLRQPLHALGLLSEGLASRLKEPPQRRLMARLRSAQLGLGSLLDALLDLSILESGALQARPEPLPLARLFSQLRREFEPLAKAKGLRLKVGRTQAWVQSDGEMLLRILRNLLSNALRYTQEGTVGLEADLKGGRVTVAVSDSGPGIPMDKREEVFKEFVQLDNPERDRTKGLGLGLAIVNSLCRLLGHKISLEAGPLGRGSRFSVDLGAALMAPGRGAKNPVPGPPKGRRSHGRVLVLDDDNEGRKALAGLLADWKLRPLAAGSVAEALRGLKGKPPQAALLDLRLREGATGLSALAQLRAELGPFPAAIVTGDTEATRLRAVKESGLPVLFKPVQPAKLRALLNHLLRG